jgi:PTH1 family peptidyl-tRNA hydrolase
MNRSGASVAAVSRYYRIPVDRMLIVHDELDLPAGVVRLKIGGGHGGHNGLRDIAAHLGGTGFARLRIGIGRPEPGWDASSHVLAPPSPEDRRRIELAIGQALVHLDAIVSGDHEAVMVVLNRRSGNGGSPPGEGPERDPR